MLIAGLVKLLLFVPSALARVCHLQFICSWRQAFVPKGSPKPDNLNVFCVSPPFSTLLQIKCRLLQPTLFSFGRALLPQQGMLCLPSPTPQAHLASLCLLASHRHCSLPASLHSVPGGSCWCPAPLPRPFPHIFLHPEKALCRCYLPDFVWNRSFKPWDVSLWVTIPSSAPSAAELFSCDGFSHFSGVWNAVVWFAFSRKSSTFAKKGYFAPSDYCRGKEACPLSWPLNISSLPCAASGGHHSQHPELYSHVCLRRKPHGVHPL